jgi:hypothetical protein
MVECALSRITGRFTRSWIRRAMLRENNFPNSEEHDEEDDDLDLEDTYREKVSELLKGERLKECGYIELGEKVYSVEWVKEKWRLYSCGPVNADDLLEVKLTEVATGSEREIFARIREIEDAKIELDREELASLLHTSLRELFWDSAFEVLAKKGEYLGSEYVESGSGSWRSDWSVQDNGDGTWTLWVVYEPEDFAYVGDVLNVEPAHHGVFSSREEAIAVSKRVGSGGWGDDF